MRIHSSQRVSGLLIMSRLCDWRKTRKIQTSNGGSANENVQLRRQRHFGEKIKLRIGFYFRNKACFNMSARKKYNQLEALGERRPPPSSAIACAKTRFNLAFRLYRPERHQNLITCYLSPPQLVVSIKFDQNPFITFSVILRTNKPTLPKT